MAIGVAAVEQAAKAAEQPAAFAAVGGRGASVAGGLRDLAGHSAGNQLAASDGFFVGDADANRTSGFARNLTARVDRALLNASLIHALIGANLDLLFTPFGAADRNFAGDSFGVADLLAHRHRALLVFRAMHPDFFRAGARGAASGAATAVASAAA